MAQLVRAFGSHPKGHRFESCWAHSLSPHTCERIRRPAKNTGFFAGLVFWFRPSFASFARLRVSLWVSFCADWFSNCPSFSTACRPLKVFIPQLQIERFGD
jgi:hypothetical protein